jgi:hypothetical protein
MRQPSAGATVRCYVSPTTIARRVYEDHFDGALTRRLGFGPASLFEPDIVALHVHDRSQLASAAAYLDTLVLDGTLRFWEQADPGAATEADEEQEDEPWELVHPPTDDQSDSPTPS